MSSSELFIARLAGEVLEAAGASIVVAEWNDPGGGRVPPMYIAPLHVHHHDDEAWYVLDGTLAVRLGDEDVEVTAGGVVVAPHGTRHTYWNPRPEPCRYLLVMTPQIKRLIDAIHAMQERSPEAMAAVFAAHESEYLGWP